MRGRWVRWGVGAAFGLAAVTGAGLLLDSSIHSNVSSHQTKTAQADAPASAVSDGTAQSTSPTQQPNLLVIGDSYTSGEVLDDPADRFTTLVADRMGWIEHNLALGGTGYVTDWAAAADDYRPDYQEVLDAMPPTPADVIMVTGGGNDLAAWSDQGDQYDAVLDFFTDLRARYPDATIYVVSPFWNAADDPEPLSQIRDDVERAATMTDCVYLDVGDIMHGHPEWILPDGDHPNPEGNEIIADRVIELMQRAQ